MSYTIPLHPRFAYHRELVENVAAAGVAPPQRWRELDARLADFLAMRSTAADRLAAQIVNPRKGVDLDQLRALALAELNDNPNAVATMHGTVVRAVERDMQAAIAAVAAEQYDAVAAIFNAAAAAFTEGVLVTNPEASAQAMVTADDTRRQAWLAAETNAARLDSLVPALLSAAALAGVRIDTADEQLGQIWWQSPVDPAAELALCVDPGKCKPRKIWEAWEFHGGRTGRWGALVALGATIRAANLDGFTKYGKPGPLIHRQEQIPGQPRGTVRMVTIDPADPDYKPPLPEPGGPGKLVAW